MHSLLVLRFYSNQSEQSVFQNAYDEKAVDSFESMVRLLG